VFLPAAGNAQAPETLQVKIEVKIEEEPIAPNYVCVLEEFRTHQRFGVADLQADETCTFRNVPSGDYDMSITDANGGALHQEMVTVSQHNAVFSVTLPRRNAQRPPGGPVSMAQLQHPPARKALAAVVAAQRFSESGDYRRAAGELEKAVRISPDFADAYTNLAVQHMRLGEYDQAVREMQHAMQLAKPGPMQLCNLAYAQLQLKQYDVAAESARAALRLDASYPQAHFLLGVLLARDRRTLPEALPHLERAAKVLPSAQTALELARKAAP
jgi:tetratricopeptide (TPR) repeat protein